MSPMGKEQQFKLFDDEDYPGQKVMTISPNKKVTKEKCLTHRINSHISDISVYKQKLTKEIKHKNVQLPEITLGGLNLADVELPRKESIKIMARPSKSQM